MHSLRVFFFEVVGGWSKLNYKFSSNAAIKWYGLSVNKNRPNIFLFSFDILLMQFKRQMHLIQKKKSDKNDKL